MRKNRCAPAVLRAAALAEGKQGKPELCREVGGASPVQGYAGTALPIFSAPTERIAEQTDEASTKGAKTMYFSKLKQAEGERRQTDRFWRLLAGGYGRGRTSFTGCATSAPTPTPI